MQYIGSKNRIAKSLLSIILNNRQQGQYYVEPFVGGANIIDKVDGNRIGADSNEYLISLFKELQNGFIPPDFVSETQWKDVRINMDSKYDKHYIAFVRFGCSFGSDWNGGYARHVNKNKPNAELLNRTTKNYCKENKNNLLKQLPNIIDVKFIHSSYDKLNIPDNSIIYCDPPYKGVLSYKDNFKHNEFYNWCRLKVKQGHRVYISEYQMPNDFICVWSKNVKVKINSKSNSKNKVEKLFVHRSQYTIPKVDLLFDF